MNSLIKFTSKIDLSGYTIVIPSVSVGNVGQLTVDLIVSTYKFRNVGLIWHPAIIPSVGSDPYFSNSSEICTACEIYANEKLKVAVIQIRSGVEVSHAVDFFKALRTAFEELNVKNVIILTSSFAYEMHTIGTGFFRYITNENRDEQFKNLNVACMEPNDSDKYIIHGSGYSAKLYDVFLESIPTTVVIKYTSEGDNRPDAMAMLDLLIRIVDFKVDKLENIIFPSSWNLLFGNAPPIEIY